tara:strand:- start:51 stop:239 length:189 start_codon:yes stop_codon:yes gene_type:complete
LLRILHNTGTIMEQLLKGHPVPIEPTPSAQTPETHNAEITLPDTLNPNVATSEPVAIGIEAT